MKKKRSGLLIYGCSSSQCLCATVIAYNRYEPNNLLYEVKTCPSFYSPKRADGSRAGRDVLIGSCVGPAWSRGGGGGGVLTL